MVTAVRDQTGDGRRLILGRSEMPVSAMSAALIFCLVAAGILSGAITLWILGVWQVMPMSLLVLLAVGGALLNGYRRAQVTEVVAIVGETVAVEKRRSKQRFEFQRGWAQVVLEEPLNAMRHLNHLYIRSHGQQIEIGAFLDDNERRDLAALLRSLIGPARPHEALSPA
jgi:uncharacterized membrane protein